MSQADAGQIATVLQQDPDALLADWIREQRASDTLRPDLLSEAELRQQSSEFLELLGRAVATSGLDAGAPGFTPVKEMLARVSRARALQGFSPTETASLVFSLKRPLFARLRGAVTDAGALVDLLSSVTGMLDKLGLYTTEVFQKSREDVIKRQQAELLELSTPVVKLWDGVLAVPLIGTLDSARTQVVMESLLARIVETGSAVAIIDITGVPTVDTLVAQHLIKTVAAARLMGAECIISGIRPQIAQTIVHLGVDLGPVTTKATLADAFRVALRQSGQAVVPAP